MWCHKKWWLDIIKRGCDVLYSAKDAKHLASVMQYRVCVMFSIEWEWWHRLVAVMSHICGQMLGLPLPSPSLHIQGLGCSSMWMHYSSCSEAPCWSCLLWAVPPQPTYVSYSSMYVCLTQAANVLVPIKIKLFILCKLTWKDMKGHERTWKDRMHTGRKLMQATNPLKTVSRTYQELPISNGKK